MEKKTGSFPWRDLQFRVFNILCVFISERLAYFRDDLPLILASLVLIALSTLAQLLQPFLAGVLIDGILGSRGDAMWVYRGFFKLTHALGIGRNDLKGQIIALAISAVGLRVMQELLAMSQRLIGVHIGYNGLIRARCDLFQKLQQLSLGYHKSQPQGDAIYRLSYDTSGFQTILTVLLNSVLVSAVTLVIMTIIMVQMSWELALITLSVAPLLLWTTKLFARPLRQRWLEAKEVDTRLTTVIQRSVASIGLVQAFGARRMSSGDFKAHRSTASANIRQSWQDSWYWLAVGTIFGVGYAAIFAYWGWAVITHRGAALTFGSLWIFLSYVNQVYAPLQSLSGSGREHSGRGGEGAAGVRRAGSRFDHRGCARRDSPASATTGAWAEECQLRISHRGTGVAEHRSGNQTGTNGGVCRLQRRGKDDAVESFAAVL